MQTMIMLETTGQLELGPYLAAAAIVGVWVSQLFTRHGLYHALIHAAGLPYLPPQYHPPRRPLHDGGAGGATAANKIRDPHNDNGPARVAPPCRCTALLGRWLRRWWGELCLCGAWGGAGARGSVTCLEVGDVMGGGGTGLAAAHVDEPRGPLRLRLGTSPHNAFPVVDAQGRPRGLLLKSELLMTDGGRGRSRVADQFSDETPAHRMMDTAPCIVHSRWPLARAHRLFATLGLRHMLVVTPESGELVGVVTRHDLQLHHPVSARTHAPVLPTGTAEPPPPAPDAAAPEAAGGTPPSRSAASLPLEHGAPPGQAAAESPAHVRASKPEEAGPSSLTRPLLAE